MDGMVKRLLVGVAVALIAAILTAAPSVAAADPFRAMQWSLTTIGADAAGPAAGAGVTVAVIDTGVRGDHEDLAGAVVASVDCIGAAGDPDACRPASGDDDGHGTHVAGIVAARSGNGRGIAGVAPYASLQSVKVLAQGCEDAVVGGVVCGAVGDSTDVEAGIRWAVNAGADVINLSVADDALGRAASGTPLAAAIEDAWLAGVVVVLAAGNDLDVGMGAGYEDVPAIVVAATGPGDTKPAYSNSAGAARWGIAAPGGDDNGACPTNAVLSTWVRTQAPNEDYACMDGTSMAAPHVAGAAAVLLSAGFSPAQAVDQLLRTAVDLGDDGHDAVYGAGRLDLAAALAAPRPPGVAAAVSEPPPAGTASASPPSSSPDPMPDPGLAAPGAASPVPSTSAPVDPGGSSEDGRDQAAPGTAAPLPQSPVDPVESAPAAWLALLAAVLLAADVTGLVGVRRRRT